MTELVRPTTSAAYPSPDSELGITHPESKIAVRNKKLLMVIKAIAVFMITLVARTHRRGGRVGFL